MIAEAGQTRSCSGWSSFEWNRHTDEYKAEKERDAIEEK